MHLIPNAARIDEKQDEFASLIGGGLSHLRLNHNAHVPDPEDMPSQRARSIAFMAYGVLSATSLDRYHSGERITLYLCENGFISINPPLTDMRLGSLSNAPISIPQGASFADMVALKGKTDIGDQINKKILGPLAQANKLSDMPDFNDPNKLGSGKEMVERLTNLVAIFENPALDFSKNRADGDDLLGDAYEYLMRHFATESGKSKGQFYTPAEVSRIIAQILGIRHAKISNDTTVYIGFSATVSAPCRLSKVPGSPCPARIRAMTLREKKPPAAA